MKVKCLKKKEAVMSKLKLGMIGNGYLGEIVVRAWKEGLLMKRTFTHRLI